MRQSRKNTNFKTSKIHNSLNAMNNWIKFGTILKTAQYK